jgi:hypothetical protein
MITETKAYRVGELVFRTIQQAQQKEILDLMCGDKVPSDIETNATEFIVEHTDQIVAILTCAPKPKKKTRSDNGVKRGPRAGRQDAVSPAANQ